MPIDGALPYNDLPSLPPAHALETTAVLRQTIAAARALADLRGGAAGIPNPRILVNGIVLQEARLSSEIENIVTTNDDLYRAASSPEESVDPQIKEVLRYREALWFGFDALADRPVCTNLYVDVVSVLKGVSMEIRRVPGTTLKDREGTVIYIPPIGEDLIREKLQNLDSFIHAEDGLDPLIRLAVMHYQFEAIHPFTDGNGRTGRIMNILYLVEQRLLDSPVLYLSQYILQHRREYYTGLRAVTETQAWEPWVLFMLRAIETTATATLVRVNRIKQAMTVTAERVKAEFNNMYSKDLIEVLFSNPYCRIQFLAAARVGSRVTVSRYLKALAAAGLLREERIGRELYYVNDELIAILSAPVVGKS